VGAQVAQINDERLEAQFLGRFIHAGHVVSLDNGGHKVVESCKGTGIGVLYFGAALLVLQVRLHEHRCGQNRCRAETSSSQTPNADFAERLTPCGWCVGLAKQPFVRCIKFQPENVMFLSTDWICFHFLSTHVSRQGVTTVRCFTFGGGVTGTTLAFCCFPFSGLFFFASNFSFFATAMAIWSE